MIDPRTSHLFWLWTEGRTSPASLRDLDDLAAITGEFESPEPPEDRSCSWITDEGVLL